MPDDVDPAIKVEFEAAVERSNKLPKQPSSIQLELYGLYKQATLGDVQGDRPSRRKIRGRAKYDAWTSRQGLSKEEAMIEYIAVIHRLEEKKK